MRLEFDDTDKVVLTADIGHTHARVSAVSISGTILESRELSIAMGPQPQRVLGPVVASARATLEAVGAPYVVGVGVGVPAPVAASGATHWDTSPMSGWSEAVIADAFTPTWPVPLVIENDARALAVGEDSLMPASGAGVDILLAVKMAFGVGAGIVVDGHPLRGSTGGAGDIGHTRITPDGPRCRCGRRGCLAAYASGRALLRRLRGHGLADLRQLVEHLDAGDPAVVEAVTAAGEAVGQVVAGLVASVNPRVVVLGGLLGHHPLVVRTVRREVRRRVLPRMVEATAIQPGRLGDTAGTVGLARLVHARLYSPDAVDAALASGR